MWYECQRDNPQYKAQLKFAPAYKFSIFYCLTLVQAIFNKSTQHN